MRNETDFVKNFRELCKNQTHKQTAELTGLALSTVSNYLSGNRTNPPASELRKIASAYGVTVDWLIGQSDFKIPDPETAAVALKTGLSDTSVYALEENADLAQVTSRLLSSDAGKTALTLIGAYLQTPAGSLENLVLDLGLIELGRPLDEAITLTPEATRAALKQFCIVQLQAHLDKMREEEANE